MIGSIPSLAPDGFDLAPIPKPVTRCVRPRSEKGVENALSLAAPIPPNLPGFKNYITFKTSKSLNSFRSIHHCNSHDGVSGP